MKKKEKILLKQISNYSLYIQKLYENLLIIFLNKDFIK